MKRPLTLAIAVALTLLAGCSASDRRDTEADSAADARRSPEEISQAATAQQALSGGGPVDVVALEPLAEAAPTPSDFTRRRDAAPLAPPIEDASTAAPVTRAPLPPPAPSSGRSAEKVSTLALRPQVASAMAVAPDVGAEQQIDDENYAAIESNRVQQVAENPVSTFSIDVDSGSYANVRRMLVDGILPPGDAVRAEEMINYFDYGYEPPSNRTTPFSVTTELAAAPWNADRTLLLVGIKGYEVRREQIPASNLVFLIDTSGSMQSPDKIELLKQAFAQLVPTLRANDRVSIVAYAGSAGLVLPPTAGSDKAQILASLDRLAAGGSTNGGAGIELAYATARQHFIRGGVNRVILATDGDFNVGTVDIEALKTLVAAKRETGIALTTLGFGAGNYNDETAEQLADIGNGNHAYIDTLAEARKVLVDEMSSTMLTIAKDVKIQMEFNPAVVSEYRLIGYENRKLRREDFNNDRVDAGEIGAGHDVTAIYELALVGSASPSVDPLRYSGTARRSAPTAGEVGFLRLRYKAPESEVSRLIERPIALGTRSAEGSERLQFAAAVAAFADALRGGTHLGTWTLDDVAALAQRARGKDADGYRGEFVALVEQARAIRGGGEPVAIAR